MPRKRAPGAGRKPAGPISGKLCNFSTRITQETRVALEAASAKTGQSISQVAEQMIGLGLDTVAERERSNPTQALTFFIAELAEACGRVGDNNFHWNTDSFVFDALAYAVTLLLQRLRPSDSALSKHLKDLDEVDREFLESPEEWARYVFKAHWDEVMNTDRKSKWEGANPEEMFRQSLLALKYYAGDPSKKELHEIFRETLRREYKLDKFRRDLNLQNQWGHEPEEDDQ